MRRLASFAPILALIALCAALLPALAAATPPGQSMLFPLRKGTEAEALAAGPNGYLWFAGVHHGAHLSANVVGKVSAQGIDEYTVPASASVLGVGGLARGPGGDMWFTEPAADQIVRVAPNGHLRVVNLPVPGSRPTGITAAPDGSLWVSLEGAGKVVQFRPNGLAAEIRLAAGSQPTAIAIGSDDALWAIDNDSGTISRATSQGRVIQYPLAAADTKFSDGTAFSDIVAGPDGKLWLSQSDGPFVANLTARETNPYFVQDRIPAIGEETTLISNGPQGDIWFAGGSVIGSISTRRPEIGEVACAVASCEGPIRALAEGPEGGLWFGLGNILGRFMPPPLRLELPKGARRRDGRRMPLAVECRGGAAGETCIGKVELLLRHGPRALIAMPLGQAWFQLRAGKRQMLEMPLSSRARSMLGAQGDLKVRVVAKLGNQVVANRLYLLRGGG